MNTPKLRKRRILIFDGICLVTNPNIYVDNYGSTRISSLWFQGETNNDLHQYFSIFSKDHYGRIDRCIWAIAGLNTITSNQGTTYPNDLKIHIDISTFQAFVNHYRFTFQRRYKFPFVSSPRFVPCDVWTADWWRRSLIVKLCQSCGISSESTILSRYEDWKKLSDNHKRMKAWTTWSLIGTN